MQSRAKAVNRARVQGKSMFLPGETCRQATTDDNPGREAGLRRQESAEVIVPCQAMAGGEGPNVSRRAFE